MGRALSQALLDHFTEQAGFCELFGSPFTARLIEAIAAAIRRAGTAQETPLAWLRLEPEAAIGGPADSIRFLVDVITWPGAVRRTLAETDGHARFVKVMPGAQA